MEERSSRSARRSQDAFLDVEGLAADREEALEALPTLREYVDKDSLFKILRTKGIRLLKPATSPTCTPQAGSSQGGRGSRM